MSTTHHHRSTLKKNKKTFKSKHATKGQLKARNQGRIEKAGSVKKPKVSDSTISQKLQRKNLAKQVKENKVSQAVEQRKLFQSSAGVEKIVSIVALNKDIDPRLVLQKIVENGTEDLVSISGDVPSITNVRFNKFKSNFKFVVPDQNDFLSILDVTRVSDFVVFAISGSEEVDPEYGEQFIRAIELQGVSNVMCVVTNLEGKEKQQKSVLDSLTSYFNHFFPSEKRVFNLNANSDLSKVVHQLSSVIPKGITWLEQRGYLIADDVSVQNGNKLVVSGTVRGSGFYVNGNINIGNIGGEFKISAIEKKISKTEDFELINEEISVANENDESIEANGVVGDYEFDDEDMEEYDEEMAAFDDANGFTDIRNVEEDNIKDVNDEDYDQGIEDFLKGKFSEKAGDGNPDVILTEEEDKSQLEQFLEEYENPGSTEELHLDPKASAIERLKKFRFALNEFDAEEKDEKTPEEWDTMMRIKNFKHSKNRLLKLFKQKLQVKMGDKVRLHIEIPPENLQKVLEQLGRMKSFTNSPFVVFGLLKHEGTKSLCNFTIKSWEGYEKPIVSKEEIIVQYGSRREIIKPIYSVNSNNVNNNSHKYLKFSLPNTINIASAIVPVTFGRVPAIFFKKVNDSLEMIGSGTFENIDTTRITVKRALLVGQPFKIHKKVVTVRYMFFNPEDVNYFKTVPIYTKSGASGFIKESLGTHGYFKASFNKKVNSHDYVYMSLYKRVWPKASKSFEI